MVRLKFAASWPLRAIFDTHPSRVFWLLKRGTSSGRGYLMTTRQQTLKGDALANRFSSIFGQILRLIFLDFT